MVAELVVPVSVAGETDAVTPLGAPSALTVTAPETLLRTSDTVTVPLAPCCTVSALGGHTHRDRPRGGFSTPAACREKECRTEGGNAARDTRRRDGEGQTHASSRGKRGAPTGGGRGGNASLPLTRKRAAISIIKLQS